MLKLIYTENGYELELLSQSTEEWLTTRVILALRTGTNLYIEPSTASFLLPADLPHLVDLEILIEGDFLTVSPCDAEYVEVSLKGTWVVETPDSEEGIFITAMSNCAEFFLFKLWQAAQNPVRTVE